MKISRKFNKGFMTEAKSEAKSGYLTKSGFTLVEVLIALVILVLAIGGFTAVEQKNISFGTSTKIQVQANALAQEGINLVKQYNDQFKLDSNTGQNINSLASRDYSIDSSSNQLETSGDDKTTLNGMTFTRTVTLGAPLSTDRARQINVIVSWQDLGQTKTTALKTFLPFSTFQFESGYDGTAKSGGNKSTVNFSSPFLQKPAVIITRDGSLYSTLDTPPIIEKINQDKSGQYVSFTWHCRHTNNIGVYWFAMVGSYTSSDGQIQSGFHSNADSNTVSFPTTFKNGSPTAVVLTKNVYINNGSGISHNNDYIKSISSSSFTYAGNGSDWTKASHTECTGTTEGNCGIYWIALYGSIKSNGTTIESDNPSMPPDPSGYPGILGILRSYFMQNLINVNFTNPFPHLTMPNVVVSSDYPWNYDSSTDNDDIFVHNPNENSFKYGFYNPLGTDTGGTQKSIYWMAANGNMSIQY